MATEKEEFLEDLGEYKNYWNAIHVAADAMAEKMVAGKVYLFVQGTTGSIIVDTANQESWDEQLVGIVGDVVGGTVLNVTGVGTAVNIAITSQGYSVGDILKSYYQDIKTDVQGQYWKYEQNLSVMVGGTMVTYDYAKVKCDLNGNYLMDNATGSPVLEKISSLSYNEHFNKLNQLQNINTKDIVSVDKVDDKFIIKSDSNGSTTQVIQSSNSNVDTSSLKQTLVIDENGNKTNLFYDENSSLLIYGETIDNPNKISFVNEDGSFEVWEKINGEFTQSVKIDNTPTNTINMDVLLDVEKSIQSFYDKNFIDTLSYERLTQNLTNYLVNTTNVYTPLVNNYFTPINIGAFYESSTSQEVSFIKSKNTIRFYQANSKEVA